ncbi:hypothetical protein M422DRAFT_259728 [Sphaerobolus stellatus SS14]|uniref:Unplaced genomic scaffold SPHSTscaffold_92, whole genome shotgun sequence n=1 Tax=Sphaerobolus stellatus (strain SS14) TaxID=990650 RepID=A0A0C9U3Y1_SPHS4|nr:hypothetical protein M422DRAFT_259728 [Sphaerobolus stellatus SS14]
MFNTRVQTIPSFNIVSIEFANSGMEYELETENGMAELAGDTTPSADIEPGVCITVEEFPWAINPVENIAVPS